MPKDEPELGGLSDLEEDDAVVLPSTKSKRRLVGFKEDDSSGLPLYPVSPSSPRSPLTPPIAKKQAEREGGSGPSSLFGSGRKAYYSLDSSGFSFGKKQDKGYDALPTRWDSSSSIGSAVEARVPRSGGDSSRRCSSMPIMEAEQRCQRDRALALRRLYDVDGASTPVADFWMERLQSDFELSEEERAGVCEQLKKNPVCAMLKPEDIDTIVDCMSCFTFYAGEFLGRKGEVGLYFCLLRTGKLDVKDDQRVVKCLLPGESFGGSALLYNNRKTVDIVASEDSMVLAVDGNQFRKVLVANTQAYCADHLSLLDSVKFFGCLSLDKKQRVCQLALFPSWHEAETIVIQEGLEVAHLCFVKSGELAVFTGGTIVEGKLIGGTEVARLTEGDSFGKWAGLRSLPSKVTVVTVTRCELVCMGIERVHLVLGDDLMQALEGGFVVEALDKSMVVSQFSLTQKRHIADAMTYMDYDAGQVVPPNFDLIVVVTGSLCRDSDSANVFLEAGQLVETSILTSQADEADIVFVKRKSSRKLSAQASRVGHTDDDLQSLRGGPDGARIATLTLQRLQQALSELHICSPEETLAQAKKMLLAREVPLFHHLSNEQIESITQSFIRVKLPKDEMVVEAGTPVEDLFIVVSGEVEEVNEDTSSRIIARGGHFGERAVLLKHYRTRTIRVVSEEAELFQLEQEDFEQIVGGKIREGLVNRLMYRETPVTLKDLRVIRQLGEGSGGMVRLVKHRNAPLTYALKRVRKQRGKVMEFLAQECALLAEIDHPFILQLVKTFETSTCMYILTEFIPGGELLDALNAIARPLRSDEGRFYAGSIVMVLEYLRARTVVYRDLKPENVMLDEHGYVRVIDFGSAKKLGTKGRTFTIIGSYHFMAPEVPLGKGYDVMVDVWSLGVMLFEFVCGHLPFGRDQKEFVAICQAVQQENLHFPDWYADSACKHLLRGMLRKHPERRIGSGKMGIREIRQHEWFLAGNVDDSCFFDRLVARELKPPFRPAAFDFTPPTRQRQAHFSDEDLLFDPAD